MPVLVTADISGVTPDLYVRTHTEIMSGGRPDGLISHCCIDKNNHISVVDLWESRELFEAFAKEKIPAAMQKLGLDGGPENLSITEVVNADAFDYRGTVLSGQ